MKLTEEDKRLLKSIIDHFDEEDRSVRDRQIRTWKELKLLWENIQNAYYDEVAHDWRIPSQDDDDQSSYDRSVNLFRAYLESIIAALSVVVPPIECYPDDAQNPLDLATAKAGKKIAELIQRHNDAPLLWIHGLFVYATEGMVACYNYTKADSKYGTYKEDKYETKLEDQNVTVCPNCGFEFEEALPPEMEGQPDICPSCNQEVIPETQTETVENNVLVDTKELPKSRQILEVFGGLYVKIPIYAKKQEDCLYLCYSHEMHYAQARAQYPDIRDKIQASGLDDDYEQWGRLSPQYLGEYPENNVTKREWWLRPDAFEQLSDEDDVERLKKLFPLGAKVCLINEVFAEAVDEGLDEHWTLTHNPLADYLHHDPLGLLLVTVQRMIEDLLSLIVQTIEHGIPQTMADPAVLNFNAYRQLSVAPGSIIPATPKSGKSLGDGFHDIKTATLSQEVLPFVQQVQSLGQVASGALPSLFGGALEDNKTASGYSMSRAQALQRLQNTWKMLTIWWKTIFNKVIPAHIASIKEDEKFVQKDKSGNFINVLIRKSELEGKIGQVELEANENLPMTWTQRKDVIMQLFNTNSPQIMQMLMHPDNLSTIRDAIGLTEFIVPGEEDRIKQYDEVNQLLNSEPIIVPPDEEQVGMAEFGNMIGQPMEVPQPQEFPSIEIDPDIDNHEIHFEICRKFLVSDAGRLAKVENEAGYKNVMLHALQHLQLLQQAMMAQQQQAEEGNKLNKEAPVMGEEDVNVQ